MTKWEYHIEKVVMPSEWAIGAELDKQWEEMRSNHLEIMQKLGKEGWEYFMSIGPLFYFKRPAKEGMPSYFTPEYFNELNKIFAQSANEIPIKDD